MAGFCWCRPATGEEKDRQRERRRIGVLRGGVEEEIATSPSRRPPARDEGTQALDLPTYRSTEKYWWALLFLVLPSQK